MSPGRAGLPTHRRPRHAAALLALLVIVSVGPVIGALALADHQSRDILRSRALLYARDVVHRTDATAQQADTAFQQLVASEQRDGACSAGQVALMRALDISSSYVQAFGRVVGTRLMCSSLAGRNDPMELGPVDEVSPTGVQIRVSARLPVAPGLPVTVLERDGYAAIVHESLPVDVTTDDEDISLAVVLLPQRRVLMSRGLVRDAWLDRAEPRGSTAFFDHGATVALVSSRDRHYAALAQLPPSMLAAEQRQRRLEVGLGGALMGLGLAVAVVYAARKRVPLVSGFRTALRRDEFFLDYQPVVDLETGRWIGAEALLRWRDPNGLLLPPDIFIPAAEQAGVIHELTRRVCELVERDARDLYAANPEFRLSVNLSSHDLHESDTLALLATLRRRLGARPGCLVVEVTERGLLDPDRARPIVAALREAGLAVAIDDFGTGYSSLAYLETFEIDCLKIDKSFVDSIDTMASTSNVVHHIIEMAQALGLHIVAEGVERPEQATYLRAQGVESAQGWLYGRPMPMEQIRQHLARQDPAGDPGARTAERPAAPTST